MEFWRAPPSTSGLAHIVMHQHRYASMIVAEYEQRHNKGKPLKPLYTPMLAREERGSEEQQGELRRPDQVPEDVPRLGFSNQDHGGKLGWLARGTRPDIAVA